MVDVQAYLDKVKEFHGDKVEILSEYQGKDKPVDIVYHCSVHGDVYKSVKACHLFEKSFSPCLDCAWDRRASVKAGDKFNRLTIIERAEDYVSPKGKHEKQWLCQCDCGNKKVVSTSHLKTGFTKSCGCIIKDVAIENGKRQKKYNEYDLSGEYGVGYTLKGQPFYFDLADYEKIKDICWSFNGANYLTGNLGGNNIVFMHRYIMDCPDDMVVDHIRGENSKNDNRRSNLRICTRHQNNMNHKVSKANTSGCVGVTFSNKDKRWCATIQENGNYHYLGYFENFDDAVKARKEAEEMYFGEFSRDRSREVV